MASYAPIGNATFYSTAFTYNALVSDGDDVVSRGASMASGGGVVKRGTILKWDPATGLLTQPVATTDCNCILVNDIDTTSAAAAAVIYVGGKFKADAVIWPGALSHALVTESLRMHDIQIESVVFTDGTLVKSAPSEAEAAEAQKHLEENRKKHEEAVKAAEAAVTGKEDPEDPNKPKPSDSVWAYLTPEEREKESYLAEPVAPVPEPPLLHSDPALVGPAGLRGVPPQHTQPHIPPSVQTPPHAQQTPPEPHTQHTQTHTPPNKKSDK